MKAMLDDIIGFEQTELSIGSWRRASIERAAAGVDGSVLIDLGIRARGIVQKGLLRAPSRASLLAKVDFVRDNQDGASHTMQTEAGEYFEDMCITNVKAGFIDFGGSGASCEIEISYVQLKDV
ncbi:MAG TPA: hypothetical protein HPP87_09565 [Planctomycetes bacterium]|nr:hypothetical protein [Planctomycetota bacterium]HIJ71593.1 hypothetical protein [Planctomycetota bacterium]